MYAIENGIRCGGMIHINRLAGRVFLLCGSEWSVHFLSSGWDKYKKVSVFSSPLFHSHSSYLLLLYSSVLEGVLLPGPVLSSRRVTHDSYFFFLRLMGLINHLYGCKFLCHHSSKLVLLEYHFLAGGPSWEYTRPEWRVFSMRVSCIFYIILFGVIVLAFVLWCTSINFAFQRYV